MRTGGDLHQIGAEERAASTAQPRSEPSGLSIVGALNEILHQRALIATCTASTFLIVSIMLMLAPPTYVSTSTFVPQAPRNTASLAGLATQFGLALPGADLGQSPAFYSDLVMTREILGAVVDSRYSDPTLESRGSVPLVEILGQGTTTPMLRRETTIRKLRQAITADVSLKTGVVVVTVESRYPAVAMQVNKRILELLNNFNLQKRQTQAGFERRFVERRLEEVRLDLRAAEDRLQNFLQRNRDFRSSPSLSFDHNRLERNVSMQHQLYTSLAQAYEQAKIDEIRDSPLITIIEAPVTPVLPNGRGFMRKGLVALMAGMLAGISLAFVRYAVRHGRAGDADELTRFRLLASETARDILRPWRKRRKAESSDQAPS